MLRELLVRDFALIDELRLDFDPGLNILTGETGAGKSIIIDALGLVLGGRFSSEMIRTAADSCYVEGVFDPDGKPGLQQELSELGIGVAPGDSLILSREVTRAGKSRCRINGQTVNVSTLAEIGARLVDVHGQHDHQSLVSADRQLDILDRFGGEETARLRDAVSLLHREWAVLREERRSLQENEADKERRLELLGYQINEIDEARLTADEEESLTREAEVLANAEKLFEACAKSYYLLYSADDNSAPAVVQLVQALNRLEPLAAVDSRLSPIVQMLREASAQAEEAAREVRGYQEQIDFSPERLAAIQSRLEEINKLKRKYGGSITAILEYAEKARAEMAGFVSRAERLEHIDGEIAERAACLGDKAGELAARRRQVATALEDAITRELADLNMQKTRFLVAFHHRETPDGLPYEAMTIAVGPTGFDSVDFLVSPNPGEEPKPLSRIASGGELSRLMLALKSILGSVDEVPTMIFDEIDAGVGGRTAQAVGEKMLLIALYRQVLCITHLPQIASMAHRHFYIEKQASDEHTVVTVKSLSYKDRVDELARMLGGAEVTELTRKHAQEMLTLAESVRLRKVGRTS